MQNLVFSKWINSYIFICARNMIVLWNSESFICPRKLRTIKWLQQSVNSIDLILVVLSDVPLFQFYCQLKLSFFYLIYEYLILPAKLVLLQFLSSSDSNFVINFFQRHWRIFLFLRVPKFKCTGLDSLLLECTRNILTTPISLIFSKETPWNLFVQLMTSLHSSLDLWAFKNGRTFHIDDI